jgi:hypothetical protein
MNISFNLVKLPIFMLRQKNPHEIKNRKISIDDCAINIVHLFFICYPAINSHLFTSFLFYFPCTA